MNSVINEIAFAVGLDVLKVFSGVLRPDEYRDALEEIVPLIAGGLRTFQTRLEWRQNRLHPCDPSKN
jgi:hypothetical protein